MGHVFTIKDGETEALAEKLSALTGQSLDETLAHALRVGVQAVHHEHLEMEKARKALAEFHGLLDDPRSASDHGWMYDDKTGLPIW